MAKRVKSVALNAPKSTEEAIALLTRFAELDADAAEIRLAAERAKAEIDAARDLQLAPVAAELDMLVARLKPWWAVRGHEIAGKRKSAQLAGCEIGNRVGNPTLYYPRAREEELLDALELAGFTWAIRDKREFDKPALLNALSATSALELDDAELLQGLGFERRQTERFFIERIEGQVNPAEGVDREVA